LSLSKQGLLRVVVLLLKVVVLLHKPLAPEALISDRLISRRPGGEEGEEMLKKKKAATSTLNKHCSRSVSSDKPASRRRGG
jgi:hypothetical protein